MEFIRGKKSGPYRSSQCNGVTQCDRCDMPRVWKKEVGRRGLESMVVVVVVAVMVLQSASLCAFRVDSF